MEPEKINIPIFDLKSIIEFLDGLALKVSIKDLKTPSMDILILIYKKFLEYCVSLTPTSFDNEPSDAGIHFDQDTLKVQCESFKFMQIYLLVKYYFDLCGIDPSFNDIFLPTRKLLMKQLSTMINFARFEFNELNDFSIIQQDNKQFIEECERLRRENDEYRIKNNYHNVKKSDEKLEIENARKRIALLKEKITVTNEQKKVILANIEKVNKEQTLIHAEEQQHKSRQHEIQKKNLLYEKLLVRSPERLNKELQKNGIRIRELEKLNRIKHEENDELRKNLFERQKFVEKFHLVMESLSSFYFNDVLNANEKIKEIESIKEQITTFNFQLKQYESIISTITNENDKLKTSVRNVKNRTEKELVQLKLIDDSMLMKVDALDLKTKEVHLKGSKIIDEKSSRVQEANTFQSHALANLKKLQMNTDLKEKAIETKLNLLNELDKSEVNSNREIISKYNKTFVFLKDV